MPCCCGPAITSCDQCCGAGCAAGSQYSGVSCNSIYLTLRATYGSQTVQYKYFSCIDMQDTFSFASTTTTRRLGCGITGISFSATDTKTKSLGAVSCPGCVPFDTNAVLGHVLTYQFLASLSIAVVDGSCVATLSASTAPQAVQASVTVTGGFQDSRTGNFAAIAPTAAVSSSRTFACVSDLIGMAVSPSISSIQTSCCAGGCASSNVQFSFSQTSPVTISVDSVSLLP